MLIERAKVICRECLGFGHTRSNCPSRKKLTEFALLSSLNSSFVAAYRLLTGQLKVATARPIGHMNNVKIDWGTRTALANSEEALALMKVPL